MTVPGRGEHALHAGARVGRAADDLDLLLAGIDEADPQPVGVGVALGRDDRGDDERFERGAAVLDPSTSWPSMTSRSTIASSGASVSRWVLSQASGRLHAGAPPVSGPRTSEGMSSGRNP